MDYASPESPGCSIGRASPESPRGGSGSKLTVTGLSNARMCPVALLYTVTIVQVKVFLGMSQP